MPELSNSLAQYLEDSIGTPWAKRRRNKLEPRWNRNFRMIKGEDGILKKFKKGEGGDEKGKEWRSDAVINIVRVKVYAALAMQLDILLPDGEIPFDLELSPYDVAKLSAEEKKFEEDAKDGMVRKIRQQQKQRRADRQMVKKLLSLLYYGIAWSKYNIEPVDYKYFTQVNTLPDNVYLIDQRREVTRWERAVDRQQVPGHEFKSAWSVFWDMEADPGKLEDGRGVYEQQLISPFDLRQKVGEAGYIKAAIKRVLDEHAKGNQPQDTQSLPPGYRHVQERIKDIVNREYWVRVPTDLIKEFEQYELKQLRKGEESAVVVEWEDEEKGKETYVLVETANGEIIRYIPRKNKELPYHMAVWEENLDEPDDPGTCPPDNLAHIQHVYNGLTRAFLDNVRLSGNVIIAIIDSFLSDPSQLDNGVDPGTVVNLSEEAEKVSDALQQFIIQDVSGGIINGLGLADRWKDMVSMLPELLQGFVLPKHKPDTAYETSQLLEQAGKYLGMGIRNIDDFLIEPETWDLYEYNMMDPDFDPESKGNFICCPKGFINYRNKVLTVQQIERLIALALTHELLAGEVKFRPHLEKIYDNMGFNPDEFLKSEDEKIQEMEQRAQIEAQARAQAFEDLALKTQIESEAKIREKVIGEESKQEGESRKGEEDFQRDIIKDAVMGSRA